MFERYRRTVEETRELDLIPVMNLFMVLIPFLLMGAAFYHIGVIPSSLPTHTPHQSDVPKTPIKVTVNLTITPDEIQLGASSTSLNPEQLEELTAAWPKRNGAYDTKSLQSYLIRLKQRYPDSDTLIVLPYEELDYQTLVSVLDDTREYSKPSDKEKDKRYELFPVVVFSRFLPPPPPEAEEEGDSQEQSG